MPAMERTLGGPHSTFQIQLWEQVAFLSKMQEQNEGWEHCSCRVTSMIQTFGLGQLFNVTSCTQ